MQQTGHHKIMRNEKETYENDMAVTVANKTPSWPIENENLQKGHSYYIVMRPLDSTAH